MKRIPSILFCLLLNLSALSTQAQTSAPADVDQRVEKILSQMTLEEKIDYIGGVRDFYVRAIPRLGVPELVMSDGPLGVRNFEPSASYPAGIAMAASWDTSLVERIGKSLGRDSRARGVHFILGPAMNIYRAPMCGRNFEYFGEDPFLASRMAVSVVKGVQSQGVIATAKHYAANNQEWDRNHVSSDMDERTFREIYLPAFEASVREGHVGAIMDSYNLVNGVHSTQNNHLNNEIAKHDWGFDGVIMSDWESTYDGVAAAKGGLDLEMPSGKFMNRESLLPAIKSGELSEAVIDDKVRRILRVAIRFGFFDRAQQLQKIPLDDPESREVALEAALGSMVLLKNDGLLPLDKTKTKTIAVIGPDAHPALTGGGGSSQVKPFSSVSFRDGIQRYLGSSAKVLFSAGTRTKTELFQRTSFTVDPDGKHPGLKAEYFSNTDLKGEPALVRTDKNVAFNWVHDSYAKGGPVDNFSARWTGYFTPKWSGTFGFFISGDDGYRLFVDDKLVIEKWQNQGETLTSKALQLEQGKHYKIRLEYFEGIGEAVIGFGISGGERDDVIPEALDYAKKADTVILCIGFSPMTESEGSDRTFELPPDQQSLVKSVLARNKRVVIVLTAGGNVDMNGWLDQTPALLHAWYPGQEGGTALAQLLFGEVSPSGKLPASFERRWEDNATYNSYYDKDDSKRVRYSEGVFLGYRHFDRSTVKPMFPFGFGLSYTTFQYGGLKLSNDNGIVSVSFTVTNTGNRPGAEVSQVYVGDGHSKLERPVKELKGFAKTMLNPGETKPVNVSLSRRAFAYFDTPRNDWTVDPGEFQILVGSSSQQIELKGSMQYGQ